MPPPSRDTRPPPITNDIRKACANSTGGVHNNGHLATVATFSANATFPDPHAIGNRATRRLVARHRLSSAPLFETDSWPFAPFLPWPASVLCPLRNMKVSAPHVIMIYNLIDISSAQPIRPWLHCGAANTHVAGWFARRQPTAENGRAHCAA